MIGLIGPIGRIPPIFQGDTMKENKQLASATALPPTQTSRRLFFFDEAGPDGARNVRHVYAPVEKLGVVIDAEKPWEEAGPATFCGTILRLDGGRLRLYYTVRDKQTRMRIAIAESDDGLKWERVPLGQDARYDADCNVIWFEGVPSGPVDPNAPDEMVADDGRVIRGAAEHCRQDSVGQPQVWRRDNGAWCMLFWFHQHGWGLPGYLYTYAESSDGLKWTVPEFGKAALLPHFQHHQNRDLTDEQKLHERSIATNDANFVYFNPWLQCFEQFSQWMLPSIPDRRVEVDNCPMYNRMIQRRTSVDGKVWSAPQLVIQADDKDPWDMQYYHMSAQYHEDWMIGSLGHYRVEDGQQTMDLELCFSRDGRTWERPLRGGLIPRDPDGRECEGVYPPNAWIDEGDTWLCLYTATARKHNQHAKEDMSPGCIMGARWAKNRFVGLEAGSVPGGFLTEVFYPQQAEITIDADIKGWLKAELCDAWGRKLDGFHLADADTVQGDSTAHVLRWQGKDATGLEHLAVRLRFEFAEGTVYGVGF